MPDIDYAKIDTLVLDVDGVLTDGRILLAPSGEELKAFHVRDESGMKYWKRAGGKLAIISGRGSPVIVQRANELHVDAVRVYVRDKRPALLDVLAEIGSVPKATCAIGDDLTDVPVLRECGLAVAVADAVAETRQVADYVTAAPGGAGCVREVIELILKQSGRWDGILARYFPRSAPAAEVQG